MRLGSLIFLFFLAVSLAQLTATAFAARDTRGIGVVPVRTAQGKQVDLYQGSHALLIGVSDYTAGWPDLESIPGELQALRKTLEAKGFNVVTVMNPGSRKLEDAFKDFIDKYGYEPENRLLFFYSGHGYTRTIGNRQKGYLVPADAPDPNIDDRGFARKSLSMSQINTWAREIEAKHALFLFDSCFSGTIFKTRALPTPRHITDKTTRPVRQFITAGSAGEEVPARSVFLPTFIRAIEGEGDVDKDGYVTGTELGQFLHKTVLSYDSGQTPQFGKIKDPDLDQGDFVFLSPNAVQATTAVAKTRRSDAPPITINAEEEFWNTVKDSSDPEDFEAFLAEFPKGRFAALARLKLKKSNKVRTAKNRNRQIKLARIGQEQPLPATVGGPRKRLAILPGVVEDHANTFTVKSVADGLRKVIEAEFAGRIEVVQSQFNDLVAGANSGSAFFDIGMFSTDLHKDLVVHAAKKYEIDLALVFAVRLEEFFTPSYKYGGESHDLFLVDVATGRSYHRENSASYSEASEGVWLDHLNADLLAILKEYGLEN